MNDRPHRAAAGYRSPSHPHGERRCPVCRERLAEAYLANANTVLDLCDAHGTFFDRNELLDVHASYANARDGVMRRRRRLAESIARHRRWGRK